MSKENYVCPGGNIRCKEYENLDGYYLKISIVDLNIEIVIYNVKALDGIRYESKIEKRFLEMMNNAFINLAIEDIFFNLCKSIDEKQYEIIKKNNTDITLVIESKDNKKRAKNSAFKFLILTK